MSGIPFRRHRVPIAVLLFVITASATTAAPATLDTLTSKDAASGLRAALSQASTWQWRNSAQRAVF
jgi:hypothetical protein